MGKKSEASTLLALQRWTKAICTTGLLPSTVVLVAGACAGFFAWTLTVTRTTLNSYIFFNNVTVAERTRLLLLLAAGPSFFSLRGTCLL